MLLILTLYLIWFIFDYIYSIHHFFNSDPSIAPLLHLWSISALHCNICFLIQYWNRYITYAAFLNLSPPLLWIIFLCSCIVRLQFWFQCCVFNFWNWNCLCKNKAHVHFLPFMIAGFIYTVHLCYLGQCTIKLVPMLDKVLRSEANSTPVNTIHHPINCQCCLLNPCNAYLHLQMRAYIMVCNRCGWS